MAANRPKDLDNPMKTWTIRTEGAEAMIDADTVEEARALAIEWLRGGWHGSSNRTVWVDGTLIGDSDADGESLTVQIDPPEPKGCAHRWVERSVQGLGGGVLIVDTCEHCGYERVTNTYASRPDTGEQGFTTVTYRKDDE